MIREKAYLGRMRLYGGHIFRKLVSRSPISGKMGPASPCKICDWIVTNISDIIAVTSISTCLIVRWIVKQLCIDNDKTCRM